MAEIRNHRYRVASCGEVVHWRLAGYGGTTITSMAAPFTRGMLEQMLSRASVSPDLISVPALCLDAIVLLMRRLLLKGGLRQVIEKTARQELGHQREAAP